MVKQVSIVQYSMTQVFKKINKVIDQFSISSKLKFANILYFSDLYLFWLIKCYIINENTVDGTADSTEDICSLMFLLFLAILSCGRKMQSIGLAWPFAFCPFLSSLYMKPVFTSDWTPFWRWCSVFYSPTSSALKVMKTEITSSSF